MIAKLINISGFLFILYSNPQQKYTKPKIKNGDRARISKYELPFRKGYKSQFTQEFFEIVAISSKKPPI